MTKVYVTQEIDVTPQLLAKIFTEADDTFQREFFEEMGDLWRFLDIETQVHAIKYKDFISDDALAIMAAFGKNDEDEYSGFEKDITE